MSIEYWVEMLIAWIQHSWAHFCQENTLNNCSHNEYSAQDVEFKSLRNIATRFCLMFWCISSVIAKAYDIGFKFTAEQFTGFKTQHTFPLFWWWAWNCECIIQNCIYDRLSSLDTAELHDAAASRLGLHVALDANSSLFLGLIAVKWPLMLS